MIIQIFFDDLLYPKKTTFRTSHFTALVYAYYWEYKLYDYYKNKNIL